MLVLHHASHSTCSQKVRIVLHEKGIEFEDIRLNLAKKDQLRPSYLALNPNGVVPTLVDDGTPIVDSSVICEYLDEKYPQNRLAPDDIIERAKMRSWMRYFEEVATAAIRPPSFNRAFLSRFDGLEQKRFEEQEANVRTIRKVFFQRMGSPNGFSKQDIDRSLHELEDTCARMDKALAAHGPWLMGEQFTLADVLVAPTIDRMADLDLTYLWTDKYPLVSEWYARLQERPAFRATYYPGSRVSELSDLRPVYGQVAGPAVPEADSDQARQ
jgi:glutathione S-transferase